jgi:threonine/homoserine/homoserine lactone efflux protein
MNWSRSTCSTHRPTLYFYPTRPGYWRQGFISDITNPKVLVFYLAVRPQFLTPVTGLHSARRLLMRQCRSA